MQVLGSSTTRAVVTRISIAVMAVIVLAACGGSSAGDGGPDDVRDSAGPAKHVIATLGDSIVAGSPLWDPDPDVRAQFGEPDRKSQWQYWVDDLPKDTELRNCGVWGERTDQIAERFATCTKGAEGVIVQGGINDIVQGRPVKEVAAELACIAERARAADLDVAIANVLPWNNGDADAAGRIRRLNVLIDDIAKRGGVPVLPFYATLDDADNPGRMPEDLTDDGNHPTPEGYRMLGEDAWQAPQRPSGSFADDC